MKFRFLTVLSLAVVLFAGACGGNKANTNVNVTNTAVVTATATATPLAANTNPALKTSMESEFKKKGFNDITVDVTTTPATIRGTYPKGKLAEVIQTAQLANGGKPVKNEAVEAK